MTARCLPPEEWARVPDGTDLAALVPMLRPGMDEVLVVEDEDGQIVGCWALVVSDHAEGIWTREDHRGDPRVMFRLLGLLKATLHARGRSRVFTAAVTDDVRSLIHRLGGDLLPDSYVFEVK